MMGSIIIFPIYQEDYGLQFSVLAAPSLVSDAATYGCKEEEEEFAVIIEEIESFRQQVEINPRRKSNNNVLIIWERKLGFEGFQEMVMGAEEERKQHIYFDGKIIT
nr:uncharacterized protein LOC109187580 [Ipomoea batatas]